MSQRSWGMWGPFVRAALVALLLALPALPALGQTSRQPVGLVTRVAGVVTLTVGAEALPATDFVQVISGEQYVVQDGGQIELVYFGDGRRERWTGPARLVVRPAGGTALAGQPQVSFLPASAVAALRKVRSRGIASAEARAGGIRARALPSTPNQAPKPSGPPPLPFDEQAAREVLQRHGADPGSPVRPGAAKRPAALQGPAAGAPAPLTVPALTARIEGPAGPALHAAVAAAGFAPKAAPNKGADVVFTARAGRGTTARLRDAGILTAAGSEALAELVLGAARIARLQSLIEAEKERALVVTLVAVHPDAAELPTAGHRQAVSVGQSLAIELANDSPVAVQYRLVEISPSGSSAQFYPAVGKVERLRAYERRRLPGEFAAAPPLGEYRYLLVATADPPDPPDPLPPHNAAARPAPPPLVGWLDGLFQAKAPAAAQTLLPGQAWGVGSARLRFVP